MKSHLSSPSVSEVRDSVMEHIRKSGVTPGGRIPTERELRKIVGVSRSRIRDALAALESQGVVNRLVGSGTYLQSHVELDAPATVAAPSNVLSTEDISLNALSPSQLIEARIAFEVSLSSIVVRNATDDDLKNLERVLAASENAKTEEEFERLDTEFHHLIAVAAHNDLLIQFSHVISKGRQAASWRHLKQQSTTPEKRNGYQSDHRYILQALQERSAEGLATAIRDHLVSIHHAVLKI